MAIGTEINMNHIAANVIMVYVCMFTRIGITMYKQKLIHGRYLIQGIWHNFD